jgi:hypothetical protein
MNVVQQPVGHAHAEPARATSSLRMGWQFLARIVATVLALLIAPYFGIRAMAAVLDPDIWWHIRTGDWIIQRHAVPHSAIFSQYSERAWVAYSWLFELGISEAHRVFGLSVLPTALICIQVLFSLSLLIALERVCGSFWRAWWIAGAAIYAIYGIPLRPMALTFLFFVAELLIIFEAERRGKDRLLLWIAPLFAVWVNIHIQFVYGLFILGLYCGTRLIAAVLPKSAGSEGGSRFPTTVLGALILAVVCSCLGPYGILPYKVALDLAIHPVQNQNVAEMAAMSFRRPEHFVRILLLMAAAFALGRSGRRDLFRPLLLAATAAVSFHFMRDAWFVCIAGSFVLAESVRPVAPEAQEGFDVEASTAVGYAAGAALALVLSLVIAQRQGLTNPQELIAAIDHVYPVRATEFVRDSGLRGPMYNTFNWGGFLIFNVPGQPVSIDPRVNIYGDDLVQRASDTAEGVDWQRDPVLARANFVILERAAPLASALAGDADYRLVYEDHLAAVFVRNPK